MRSRCEERDGDGRVPGHAWSRPVPSHRLAKLAGLAAAALAVPVVAGAIAAPLAGASPRPAAARPGAGRHAARPIGTAGRSTRTLGVMLPASPSRPALLPTDRGHHLVTASGQVIRFATLNEEALDRVGLRAGTALSALGQRSAHPGDSSQGSVDGLVAGPLAASATPLGAGSPAAGAGPAGTTSTAAPATAPGTTPTTTTPTTATPTATDTTPPATKHAPGGSGDPLAGADFYVPTGQPWDANIAADVAANPAAVPEEKIAQSENAIWLTGTGDPQAEVDQVETAAAGAVPVFVLYAIPGRDCGSYSAGGMASPAAYQTYVSEVVAGLAGRRAVVIVEPDALALGATGCSQLAGAPGLIAGAVHQLGADPAALTYLDIGNEAWLSPAQAASVLVSADVAGARGFSSNVSNYFATSTEQAYDDQIVAALAADGVSGKHYVIDTSRNGNGPDAAHSWCNAPGRALGVTATADTGNVNNDALLWVKVPGQSDGTCGSGQPAAGQWYAAYALGLADGNSP